MTDADLLGLRNVGPVLLRAIRSCLPFQGQRVEWRPVPEAIARYLALQDRIARALYEKRLDWRSEVRPWEGLTEKQKRRYLADAAAVLAELTPDLDLATVPFPVSVGP